MRDIYLDLKEYRDRVYINQNIYKLYDGDILAHHTQINGKFNILLTTVSGIVLCVVGDTMFDKGIHRVIYGFQLRIYGGTTLIELLDSLDYNEHDIIDTFF